MADNEDEKYNYNVFDMLKKLEDEEDLEIQKEEERSVKRMFKSYPDVLEMFI